MRNIIKNLKISIRKVFYRVIPNSSFLIPNSDFWHSLLGYTPEDLTLYEQALTHRSAQNGSNERLEYLGDAVLGLVVADFLFTLYPDQNEGFLTRARSKVVCRENLNKTARKIGLVQHLHAGYLKENSENVYGNAYEALVGAIWLEAGFEKASAFIHNTLIGDDPNRIKRLIDRESDFKSRLLEWGQAQKKTVVFRQESEQYDPQHDRHSFVYSVLIDGKVAAQAAGHSKASAQQNAARRALQGKENV